MECKNINGQGLKLLEELDSTYKIYATAPYLESLKSKWNNISREPDESVDVFYSRFTSFVSEINKTALTVNGIISIAPAESRRKFILSLGKPFENLIRLYKDGVLRSWNTISWDELRTEIRTVENDYQLENPTKGGGTKKSSIENGTKSKEELEKEKEERTKWREKVAKLVETSPTLSSPAFQKLQKECLGCCIYHKTKSHQTEECTEIRKIQNRVKAIAESIKANHSQGQIDTDVSLISVPTDEKSNRDKDTNASVTPYMIKAYCIRYKDHSCHHGSKREPTAHYT
jgi:hypothetical protein